MRTSHKHSIRTLILAAGLAVAAPAVANPVAILRQGDTIEGNTVTLGTVATNGSGGYAIGLTAGTLAQFWGSATGGPGALLRTEATFGPLVQTAFEGFYGFANSGALAYSATGTGGPVDGFDSVWVDDTPIAVEGDPVPSLPGQFWVFGSRPTMTATGEPWWVSGYSAVQGGSTQARGLFRGTDATPVLVTGDMVGGVAETVNVGTAVSFSFRVSDQGNNWIGNVVLTGATSADNVVVSNGDAIDAGGALLREGTVMPVGLGGDGVETYQAFANFGINSAGDWLVCGDTNGAAATDAFVMINGEVVLREGDVVGGFPTTGSFDWADLNEQGDWVVSWNVTDGGTREALIFNGQLLLRETQPIDRDGDGEPDGTITLTDLTTGIDNLYMSNRFGNGEVDIYFTGNSQDVGVEATATEVFYRMTVFARCSGDFDNNGSVEVPDIFAFLSAWFSGDFTADFDRDGDIDVPDIFAFLSAWFSPCV
jgi:uncharacterized Zn-binding protein involved in type VI secretion